MKVRMPGPRLEQLISEDVPYIDLTSEVLGISDKPGSIEYFTREDCVLCGTEVATPLFKKLGASSVSGKPSGSRLSAGETFFRAEGAAGVLHMGWKVCLNVFDHCSAVASATRAMVDAVHTVNPECEVLTTRKSMPGAKDLLTMAVTAGGAYPHRLGLSETVLVFDNHIAFMGGFDAFLRSIPKVRHRCIEKKLFVETDVEHARALADAGVDGLQFDKVSPVELAPVVAELHADYPHLVVIAAGGINMKNAAEYAATGVDGLATTAPFFAKALDMSVRMAPLA